MAALTALILHYPCAGIDFHELGMVLLWLALLATVASGVSYFWSFFKQYPESPAP
jgi:CDP-diacylglycerol--glycerol-3-phosphate 3-phosphatidyltransferase